MNRKPSRKTIRLQKYDYRSKGIYHVIICADHQQCIFGRIEQGEMRLNDLGRIVWQNVRLIQEHFPMVEVIAYVVMPNHVHLLLGLGIGDNNVGTPTITYTLGQIINVYKGSVTRMSGRKVWQSRFYEHIIRGQRDLIDTIEYIQNNPVAWETDDLNNPVGTR